VQVTTAPDWKVNVYVRALSAGEQIAMSKAEPDPVATCIACLCDEQGQSILTEADTEALSAGPVRPVLDCAMAVLQLSGLSTDDLEGNSETPPSAGSPTG